MLALGARRVERALRGGYRRTDFRYQYALDEVPHYADYQARALGGRYTLAVTEGRAERLSVQGIAAAAEVHQAQSAQRVQPRKSPP